MKSKIHNREPLLQTPLPKHPWEQIATDLFEIKGVHYLQVVDYYSRYVEVQWLNSTTTITITTILKSWFAQHGISEVVVSNNGPQYTSREMKKFAYSYGFTHITSSPHYPQSNRQAERAVKSVKALLEHSPDPYIAGADLEHNLGGGQEHARGTGRASGERCGKVFPSPCEVRKL